MDELTGSVLADLRRVGNACSTGRLPTPQGSPDARALLTARYPSMVEEIDRSTTTIKNVKLTSVLGCSLPKEICDIMHVLQVWAQKPPSEEKHQDARLIVEAYGDVNVHTAMTVMEYRDMGQFRMCRCKLCQEFFKEAV